METKVNITVITKGACGSEFMVVGELREVGEWDPARGQALNHAEPADEGLVTTTVHIRSKATSRFEFKIVKKTHPDDAWTWWPAASNLVWDQARHGNSILLSLYDGTGVIKSDPYLQPHKSTLEGRAVAFSNLLARLDSDFGGLEMFSRGYEAFGFNRAMVNGKAGIMYREWAPNAQSAALIGDFNGWNRDSCPCIREKYGDFSVFLPDIDGTPVIPHNTNIKVALQLPSGEWVNRVPAWIRYAVLDRKASAYCGVYWCPPVAEQHVWRNPRMDTRGVTSTYPEWFLTHSQAKSGIKLLGDGPKEQTLAVAGIGEVVTARTDAPGSAPVVVPDKAGGGGGGATHHSATGRPGTLKIYESHVGMSGEEPRVTTYKEYTANVLPRVKALGYTCVQLMAVMEHAYYASFGYQVTNFFAISSRSGPPEDLKELIDTAHDMGLMVIIDLVHSHASSNVDDGLNQFDGSGHLYFHKGGRGNHDLWGSRLFNYGDIEVLRFLLSNIRFYVEEYRVDGFRFDGVTSMLYRHHGIATGFSGDYGEYFGDRSQTDDEALTYLMMANALAHSLQVPALTIAEDVSGMPTLGRPVWEGGLGFDTRLAMALPDMWIKILKELRDEDWDMGHIVHTLSNRRHQERTVAYAESHDQALVGDKTLIFWLLDKEMYTGMSSLQPLTPVVDRGIQLHKMIRLITSALGGEGYLNFMGNEFGHPEWIDFPRAGNQESFHYCRRQWSLADSDYLRYRDLNNWDIAMNKLEGQAQWLNWRDSYISLKHEEHKMVVFETAGLVFVFNFHHSLSQPDYTIGMPEQGEWRIVLTSDDSSFGGHGRVDKSIVYQSHPGEWNNRPAHMKIYAVNRAVQVFAKVADTRF